jgi:hypothetical protein
MRFLRAVVVVSGLVPAITSWQHSPVAAQESWDPFRSQAGERRPRPKDAAPSAQPPVREQAGEPVDRPPPAAAPRGGVESRELAPIMAPDASGLPLELWRGLDLKTLEGLLAGLDLPPRSPAVHQLWRRMLLSSATPPAGSPNDEHFVALRLEALYRSGLLDDMEAILKAEQRPGPVVQVLKARRDIGLGLREGGCEVVKTLAAPSSGLPGRLKGEAQLLSGYCAAAANDPHAAGLAAELAREEGLEAELPLAVLGAIAAGSKPKLTLPRHILLLDYRFLELLGPVEGQVGQTEREQLIDRAEPALLVMLARDGQAGPRLQVAAAEAALRLNALSPEAVAGIYRRQSVSGTAAADPSALAADPLLRRALFLKAADLARAPQQRARFLQAIADDARRSGLLPHLAPVVAPALAGLEPSAGLADFAPTAVEVALAAGDIQRARQWVQTASAGQWLAMVDVADPERRDGRLRSLAAIEDLAGRGRLGVEALHRLATVLDALDIDVPIAIWDAASRTPQPAGGHLPETGILADLAQSAGRGETGRTILLAMRALGPGGPAAANVLALGDVLRALRRVRLETDARRLALEALLPVWPRGAGN